MINRLRELREERYVERCNVCGREFNPVDLVEYDDGINRELLCEDCYINREVSYLEELTNQECR